MPRVFSSFLSSLDNWVVGGGEIRKYVTCSRMFYVQVSKFSGRFKTIPDMLEADHLTVSGDVTFGKDVSLKVRYQTADWTRLNNCK